MRFIRLHLRDVVAKNSTLWKAAWFRQPEILVPQHRPKHAGNCSISIRRTWTSTLTKKLTEKTKLVRLRWEWAGVRIEITQVWQVLTDFQTNKMVQVVLKRLQGTYRLRKLLKMILDQTRENFLLATLQLLILLTNVPKVLKSVWKSNMKQSRTQEYLHIEMPSSVRDPQIPQIVKI